MARAGSLSILISAFVLAGCSTLEGHDNAGYRLPQGSIAGVRAFIEILPRSVVTDRAIEGGMASSRHRTINGLTRWLDGPAGQRSCFITLSADAAGLAALEHELWHCKLGNWHD